MIDIPSAVSAGHRAVTLRRVDPLRCAMQWQLRRFMAFHADMGTDTDTSAVVSSLDSSAGYLRFEADIDIQGDGSARRCPAYWAIDDLFLCLFGEDRIVPDYVDDTLALALACDMRAVEAGDWGLPGVTIARVVEIVKGRECRELLFACDSAFGTLYLSALPGMGTSSDAVVLATLPVPLAWRVGRSFLRRASLRTLREGDVVRVARWRPTVCAEHVALFPFTFDGETVVIQPADDEGPYDDDDDDAPSSAVIEEGAIAFDRIPLACEFVLPMKTYQLDELNLLAPGETLTLSADALRQVEMRIGRQCIAVGELVQIGEQIGFEVGRVLVK